MVRVLEGSRRRSAKLVRGQRKPGCSPPPTKAARFCSRREESIGSCSFTGAPWRWTSSTAIEKLRGGALREFRVRLDPNRRRDLRPRRGARQGRYPKARQEGVPTAPLRVWSHAPLSLSEKIPWDCRRLVVGTGAQGALPHVPELRREAERRGVELVSLPTADAIALLEKDSESTNAVLHVTC